MMNILLFVHIVISILLITTILLQKTGSDSLSGLSSGGGIGGIMTSKATSSFLVRTTVILALLFLVNAIILANISYKKKDSIIDQMPEQKNSVPIAQ